MTQSELVQEIATLTGSNKTSAKLMLEALKTTVTRAVVAGDKVVINDLGSFGSSVHKARQGRNPGTGEVIAIPEKRLPKFTASKTLKDALS
jgi:DNA-binding protein HU-beta